MADSSDNAKCYSAAAESTSGGVQGSSEFVQILFRTT